MLTERGYLNIKTGEFTIRNVALTDTNTYTPEINNIIQDGIKLKVLREWMSYTPLAVWCLLGGGSISKLCVFLGDSTRPKT